MFVTYGFSRSCLEHEPPEQRAISVLLVVSVLSVVSVSTLHTSYSVALGSSNTITLKVNWGAVVLRVVAIAVATAVVLPAAAITLPVVAAAATGMAAAFDLGFNRCSYGINWRC